MSKKWFISYRTNDRDMLGESLTPKFCNVITDVTPVRWLLESQYVLGGERVILYVEEITSSMAVELSHGGCGVPTSYFETEIGLPPVLI